jgi:hypothetical protein
MSSPIGITPRSRSWIFSRTFHPSSSSRYNQYFGQS